MSLYTAVESEFEALRAKLQGIEASAAVQSIEHDIAPKILANTVPIVTVAIEAAVDDFFPADIVKLIAPEVPALLAALLAKVLPTQAPK